MKLTIIGSTGKTGRHVVAKAISRGHAVTATTRRPDALESADAVTVIHCDGRDHDTMRRAVDGADAVIAIVAASSRRRPHQAADVAHTLTAVMVESGAPRLVVTSLIRSSANGHDSRLPSCAPCSRRPTPTRGRWSSTSARATWTGR